MNLLESLTNALQYPQSVLTGALASRSPNELSPEDRLERMIRGLKGGYRPSDAMGNPDGIAGGIAGNAADLLVDPTLAIGGAAKALGLGGKLLSSAGTFGKLEDASRGEKAAQAARRLYQGTLMTGDPLSGIGAGAALGLAENKLMPVATRLLSRVSSKPLREAEELIDPTGREGIFDPSPRQVAVNPTGDDQIEGLRAALEEASSNFGSATSLDNNGLAAALEESMSTINPRPPMTPSLEGGDDALVSLKRMFDELPTDPTPLTASPPDFSGIDRLSPQAIRRPIPQPVAPQGELPIGARAMGTGEYGPSLSELMNNPETRELVLAMLRNR